MNLIIELKCDFLNENFIISISAISQDGSEFDYKA